MTKHPDSAVAWAVHLGANTIERLSGEWDIGVDLAAMRLRRALRNGAIIKLDSRRYAANPWTLEDCA